MILEIQFPTSKTISVRKQDVTKKFWEKLLKTLGVNEKLIKRYIELEIIEIIAE